MLFHAVFSFVADVDRDHQKLVHTLSRRVREVLMQEDEPRRRQPRSQPAAVTQRINTARHATMEAASHVATTSSGMEWAAGAQMDAA